MLKKLSIQNLAIIENVELDFGDGFNVLTGETGAGKSIIVSALQLLTGKQATESLIRSSADSATIEGIFSAESLLDNPDIAPFLQNDSTLIVWRKFSRDKAGFCRLNNHTVTLKTLKSLISPLLQITGQHDTHRLFDPAYHQSLLDGFAGDPLAQVLSHYKPLFQEKAVIERQLSQLKDNHSQRDQKCDFLAFQIQDISQQKFNPAEEDKLNEHRSQAKNAHIIQSGLQSLQGSLSQVITQLAQSERDVKNLISVDPFYETISAQFTEQRIAWEDVRRDLASRHQAAQTYDTLSIDEIETRLDTIFKYKTKYKVQTLDALLTLKDTLESELDAIQNKDQNADALQKRHRTLTTQCKQLAEKLHSLRLAAAKLLQTHIQTQMKDLNFANNQFIVTIVEDGTGVCGVW